MEYTRSVGDFYETFEGTPEEIAKLLKEVDKIDKKAKSNRAPLIPGLPDLGPLMKSPVANYHKY